MMVEVEVQEIEASLPLSMRSLCMHIIYITRSWACFTSRWTMLNTSPGVKVWFICLWVVGILVSFSKERGHLGGCSNTWTDRESDRGPCSQRCHDSAFWWLGGKDATGNGRQEDYSHMLERQQKNLGVKWKCKQVFSLIFLYVRRLKDAKKIHWDWFFGSQAKLLFSSWVRWIEPTEVS